MELIPGLLQGLTRVTISYPADVLKVQMQKQLYPDTISAFKHIAKTDPFKFYRGSSICYTIIGFDRSLQFYFLEKINKKYNQFTSAFIVSLFNSIYMLPMQYLTTNISLLNKNNNVLTFIKNTKIRDLYKGYFIETPKNILSTTIYLGSYLKFRSLIDNNKLYPFIGGLSGIITWLVVYPIDTIRTELQTTQNIKIKELILNRININGFKSFYKGITPVLVRTFPSSFMGMYVYEKTRQILQLN